MEIMSELIRTPEVIASEINVIREQVRSTVLSAAIQIGKRLIEAKRLVPAGRWTEWLTERVNYSVRTAQNMMALADEYGQGDAQALADLSVTKAVLLLSVPRDEREEFMENNDVREMSTRELQAEIARLKEEKASLQVSMDELANAAGSGLADEIQAENERLKKDLADARGDIQRAKDAEKKSKEEIKKLKDGMTQQGKMLAEANEDKKRLEKAVEDARQPVIQQVTPPDVEKELAALRAQTKRSGQEQALRAAYDMLKGSYDQLAVRLNEMEAEDRELAKKYRVAFSKGLRMMIDKLLEDAAGTEKGEVK